MDGRAGAQPIPMTHLVIAVVESTEQNTIHKYLNTAKNLQVARSNLKNNFIMKITWVLEKEMFSDGHARLAEAAQRAGHNVEWWDLQIY